ncbi:hypothetical protein Q4I32_006288 [Leishmania shawi]|uniref:Uncharacterized protein n=1 Tax=Leishmania shawi TaxID=5680 RepID=A0AAW3BI86_9TRYP
MGTAPSAEIVCDAPFRAPQGGARQVALIPIVEQYFPTPDCPLFKQLYEAYTDPSVRYYMRPNFDGKSGDLSRIPPIENSCEDMHRLLLRHTAQGMFPTNAAIREVYEVGDFYRIRPVLCAVVFLYEGTSYMPEGSVQLSSPSGGASAFAKVIGIIGDTCTLVNKPDDLLIPFGRDDVLRIRTLIMKSAGDHNMSRVVLLAAYIYYHQCCSIIGLPNIPALPFSFMCFKTNIPFLCFLREMRDRMANVLEAPKSSKFFIDEHCLHGVVSREYVAKMMPAFACYYISFLKAKSEQRALKQPAQQQQQHLLTDCGGKDRAGWAANSLVNRADTHLGSVYTEAANSQAVMAIKAAALEGVLNDGSNTAPKITYVVKGYITRSVTSISNWSHAANEVYVACVDSTVRVVDRTSVEARDGPTRTPSLVYQADPIEGDEAVDGTTAAVAIIQVHRGDILSFYVPSGTRSTDASPTFGVTAAQAVNGDDNIFYGTPHLETLKFSINMSSSLSFEAPSRHDSASFAVDAVRGSSDEVNASTAANSLTGATGVDGNATPFEAKKGSWRVDDNIFIENVLLSLVRDECKLAREATRQDPGWVYDPLHKCLVHDGSFYVWHFRRGHEDFYYGTVPKFANPNRQLSRKSGGGSGGNVEQGKTNRGGVGSAGASKDSSSGSRNATARGRNDNASPLPSAMNSSTAQVDALPPSVPPLPRQNRLFSQPLSPPPHLQHTALLPPTLATASPLVQQAYFASIAASASLPPPPAYDASTLSAVQAAPMLFTANTGQRRPKNPTYATYSAEAAAMAPAGVPMMYTFMHPTQAQSQLAPAQQQHPPLQDLYTLPPQRMHSHGMSPPPPSPQQQQAVWGMLGAENGQATAASSHSIRPCIVNAQGQFIPLENVMGGEIAPAQQLSYTQPAATATPPLYPSYVMVNGQLCILQSSAPSAAAAAPLPPQPNEQYLHMMAFRQ